MVTLPSPSQTVRGARWLYTPVETQAIHQYSLGQNVSPLLSEVLIRRGIEPLALPDFLNPKLKTLLPNPSHFKGMDQAVDAIASALESSAPLGIFGDYDVDGATSAALLATYFQELGISYEIHIPDRLQEGYGVSQEGLKALQEKGCTHIVTVDCGTSSHEALSWGKEQGLSIIVLDHHQGSEENPPCTALVNPNQVGEVIPYTYLCGAGVTYLFLVGLHRALREKGYFEKTSEPNLLHFLDFVALGTVCDVVPLKGLNRAFVSQGLKIMSQNSRPGIQALMAVGGIEGDVKPYHCGFVLGPRINAGGRIGDASLGVKLLSTSSPEEAQKIAEQLDKANDARQMIEIQAVEEAKAMVEVTPPEKRPKGLCVFGKDWHPGIVGLVASRLKDLYHCPVFAGTFYNSDEAAVGSGRSIRGFDLGQALIQAVEKGILLKGGGHPMAGGFTVARDKQEAFQAFLSEATASLDLTPRYEIEGVVSCAAINASLIEALEDLQPTGMGNPSPQFLLQNVILTSYQSFGKNHLKAWVQDPGGTGLPVLAFRAEGTPIEDFFKKHRGASISILGSVSKNEWKGRTTYQFIGEDYASFI